MGGAVITTILASISWQLAASSFPIMFLNTPFTYFLLVIALALEFIGICAGAWVCARIQKSLFKYQYDEVYIGTPEERLGFQGGQLGPLPHGTAIHGAHGRVRDQPVLLSP